MRNQLLFFIKAHGRDAGCCGGYAVHGSFVARVFLVILRVKVDEVDPLSGFRATVAGEVTWLAAGKAKEAF